MPVTPAVPVVPALAPACPVAPAALVVPAEPVVPALAVAPADPALPVLPLVPVAGGFPPPEHAASKSVSVSARVVLKASPSGCCPVKLVPGFMFQFSDSATRFPAHLSSRSGSQTNVSWLAGNLSSSVRGDVAKSP
jgi:hypothetical protein